MGRPETSVVPDAAEERGAGVPRLTDCAAGNLLTCLLAGTGSASRAQGVRPR